MSVVTDVILVEFEWGDDGKSEAMDYVKELYSFNRVDQHAGGSKCMQCTVHLAAINYLDHEELLERVRAAPWGSSEHVQVFLKSEDGNQFIEHNVGILNNK